jgi:hypothetical protein
LIVGILEEEPVQWTKKAGEERGLPAVANTPRLDLYRRRCVAHRLVENIQGRTSRLLFHAGESRVDDPFCRALLAADHHLVDEHLQLLAVVFAVRHNLAPACSSASRHG